MYVLPQRPPVGQGCPQKLDYYIIEIDLTSTNIRNQAIG